jgi:Cu/Ag efflux pump CusA
MDEGAFVLDYAAPPGMPLADTDRQLRQVEQVLMSTPEVESYSRRTGLEMGFFTTEPSRGDLMVKLKPRGIRHKTSSEVAEEVLARCKELLPGMELETVAPIADRVNDIAGEPSPIEVKVFGDDAETLDKLAVEVQGVVKSIRGSADSVHDVVATGPELAIHVDPERASRLGVTTRDVARTIQASMIGRTDSFAVDGERVIGIRVALPKNARRTLEEVRELPVLSKSGKLVPLSAIATFSENPGAHEVTRENQKPVMLVTAALSGRDLGSANREAKERVAKEVKLPPGYTVQFGGLYATQQASFASLTMVLVTSMLLVFVVLLFQYNRFAEPAALLLAAAFSLVGVIGVMKVTGTHLNASSMTGAIMIFGMVLTNGIVLMDTIGLHRSAGLPLTEAILRAGVQRVRPVFMTASIAVLALLPLAFSVGAGADMQKPLAIAVIGGLLVSPVFTLVLAPVLMYVFRRGR